jgi:hypothetical protein
VRLFHDLSFYRLSLLPMMPVFHVETAVEAHRIEQAGKWSTLSVARVCDHDDVLQARRLDSDRLFKTKVLPAKLLRGAEANG